MNLKGQNAIQQGTKHEINGINVFFWRKVTTG
jgi:hypothetical protein